MVPQYIKPRKYHNAIPQRQNLLPFPQQNTRQPLIGIPRDVNESNTTQLNVTQRSQTANNSHIQCFNPQNRYQNTYHQNSGDYQIYHNQNPNAFACESSRNTTYENHTPVSLPYHSQNQICVYPPPQNEVHQNQTITNSVIDREVPTSSNNSATFEDDPINEFLDDNQHQSGSDIVQLVDDFDFDLTAEEFKKIFLESPNNLQQDLVETSEASEAGPASARRRRKRVMKMMKKKGS
uniref:Uncharacterized protein n=1 Tax=Panagrolaimus superbus TaxID=310955 RepID=A0A914YQX9_9BILA